MLMDGPNGGGDPDSSRKPPARLRGRGVLAGSAGWGFCRVRLVGWVGDGRGGPRGQGGLRRRGPRSSGMSGQATGRERAGRPRPVDSCRGRQQGHRLLAREGVAWGSGRYPGVRAESEKSVVSAGGLRGWLAALPGSPGPVTVAEPGRTQNGRRGFLTGPQLTTGRGVIKLGVEDKRQQVQKAARRKFFSGQCGGGMRSGKRERRAGSQRAGRRGRLGRGASGMATPRDGPGGQPGSREPKLDGRGCSKSAPGLPGAQGTPVFLEISSSGVLHPCSRIIFGRGYLRAFFSFFLLSFFFVLLVCVLWRSFLPAWRGQPAQAGTVHP